MQVILLRDVSGIGQKGSVKSVSDGHALNYLIPNKLAVMATPEQIKAIETQKIHDAQAAKAQDAEWRVLAKKLEGAKVTLKANASEQGHLYEKISAIEISRAINQQLKATVPPNALEPKMAIKEVGEWPVTLKLGAYTTTMIVVVMRN